MSPAPSRLADALHDPRRAGSTGESIALVQGPLRARDQTSDPTPPAGEPRRPPSPQPHGACRTGRRTVGRAPEGRRTAPPASDPLRGCAGAEGQRAAARALRRYSLSRPSPSATRRDAEQAQEVGAGLLPSSRSRRRPRPAGRQPGPSARRQGANRDAPGPSGSHQRRVGRNATAPGGRSARAIA